MRKLASIQQISHIEPIPKADAIERARLLGWWLVIKKGEFAVGDKVVYCEVDSLLPERPEFEFLRAGCFKAAILDGEVVVQPAGFRIRTVKLRGQVSQGICFPLSILPAAAPTEIDSDVTEALGIHKWEPPLPVGMSGRVKGHFPGFLSKTDETRIQILEPVLERHRGRTFYVTEKVDGTSFSAFLRKGEFGICSRNLWMDETDETNILARITKTLQLREKLELMREKFGFEPAIQGEVIGPGIQGNKYGLSQVDLLVFNVLDLAEQRLVDHEFMLESLEAVGLKSVPQLGTIVLDHTVDELVEFSIDTSVLNGKVQREGVVLRTLAEEFDFDLGGRLSFKVINPKFLLKFDE